MRLLNARTYELEEVCDDDAVKYAILSHCWGDQEILFEDRPLVPKIEMQKPESWHKIKGSCKQAIRDGLEYIWIDTCCIDRKSSAELSEAINSMFRWYAKSKVCYVYLGDVGTSIQSTQQDEASQVQVEYEVGETTLRSESRGQFTRTIGTSRWLERGWTLQELLAPARLMFYDKYWAFLGDRHKLSAILSQRTRIREIYLSRSFATVKPVERPCIAEIMTWARHRRTSRGEDRAYSLMGLFGINMPLLYGEGATKAFIRLQEEILRRTVDQSIFAWTGVDVNNIGALAPSPDHFPLHIERLQLDPFARREPHQITNEGLKAEFRLQLVRPFVFYAWMNFYGKIESIEPSKGYSRRRPPSYFRYYGILLKQVDETGSKFARLNVRQGLGELSECVTEVLFDLVFQDSPLRMITIVSGFTSEYELQKYYEDDLLGAEIRWLDWSGLNPDNDYSPNFDYLRKPRGSWQFDNGTVWQWATDTRSTSAESNTVSQEWSTDIQVGLAAELVKIGGVTPIKRIQMGFDCFCKPILVLSLTNNCEKDSGFEGLFRERDSRNEIISFAEYLEDPIIVDRTAIKLRSITAATFMEWQNGYAFIAKQSGVWNGAAMIIAADVRCTDGSIRELVCELGRSGIERGDTSKRWGRGSDPPGQSPWLFSMRLDIPETRSVEQRINDIFAGFLRDFDSSPSIDKNAVDPRTPAVPNYEHVELTD